MNMARTVRAPVTPRRGAALEKAQDALCRQVESLTSELKAKSQPNSPPSSLVPSAVPTPPRETSPRNHRHRSNAKSRSPDAAATANDMARISAELAAEQQSSHNLRAEIAACRDATASSARKQTAYKEKLKVLQTKHDAYVEQSSMRLAAAAASRTKLTSHISAAEMTEGAAALKLLESQKEAAKLKRQLKEHEARADQLATQLSAALTTLEAEHASHLDRLSSELSEATAQLSVHKKTSASAALERDAAILEAGKLQAQVQDLKAVTAERDNALESAKSAADAELAENFIVHARQVSAFEETVRHLNDSLAAAESKVKESTVNGLARQSQREADAVTIAKLRDELVKVSESRSSEVDHRTSLEMEVAGCKEAVEQLERSLLSATEALADASELHDQQQSAAAAAHAKAFEQLQQKLAFTKSEVNECAVRYEEQMEASLSANSIALEQLESELVRARNAFSETSATFTAAQDKRATETNQLQAELSAAQSALVAAAAQHKEQQQQKEVEHATVVGELRQECTSAHATTLEIRTSLHAAQAALTDASQLHKDEQEKTKLESDNAVEQLRAALHAAQAELTDASQLHKDEQLQLELETTSVVEKVRADLFAAESALADASKFHKEQLEEQEFESINALADAAELHKEEQEKLVAESSKAIEQLRADLSSLQSELAAAAEQNSQQSVQLALFEATVSETEVELSTPKSNFKDLTEHQQLQEQDRTKKVIAHVQSALQAELKVAKDTLGAAVKDQVSQHQECLKLQAAVDGYQAELLCSNDSFAALTEQHNELLSATLESEDKHNELLNTVFENGESMSQLQKALDQSTSAVIAAEREHAEEMGLEKASSELLKSALASAQSALQDATLVFDEESKAAFQQMESDLASSKAEMVSETKVYEQRLQEMVDDHAANVQRLAAESESARSALADAAEIHRQQQDESLVKHASAIEHLNGTLTSAEQSLRDSEANYTTVVANMKAAHADEIQKLKAAIDVSTGASVVDQAALKEEVDELRLLLDRERDFVTKMEAQAAADNFRIHSSTSENDAKLRAKLADAYERVKVATAPYIKSDTALIDDVAKVERLEESMVANEEALAASEKDVVALKAEISKQTGVVLAMQHAEEEYRTQLELLQNLVPPQTKKEEASLAVADSELKVVETTEAVVAVTTAAAAVRQEEVHSSDPARFATDGKLAATQVLLETAHAELAVQAKQTKQFKSKNEKLRGKNSELRSKLINAISRAKKIKASRTVARQERSALKARVKLLGVSLARQAMERGFDKEHSGASAPSRNTIANQLANKIW